MKTINKQYPKPVNEYKRIEKRNKVIEELELIKELDNALSESENKRNSFMIDKEILNGMLLYTEFTEEEEKRAKEFREKIESLIFN